MTTKLVPVSEILAHPVLSLLAGDYVTPVDRRRAATLLAVHAAFEDVLQEIVDHGDCDVEPIVRRAQEAVRRNLTHAARWR